MADALGAHVADYDFDGLVSAYRAAINEVLPEEIFLAGNEFYGPAAQPDWDEDLPTDEFGALDLTAIMFGEDGVGGVDLYALAEQYDQTS